MKNKFINFIKKKNKKKLVCLTAYSKNIAKILDKYCDLILVGDSLANVLYGMTNTRNITLDMMIKHSASVNLGVKKAISVVDMPKNTYNNKSQAILNAKKIIKKSKCDAVKVESNYKNSNIIKAMTKSGIKVMGHIGYTPQYKNKFKPQGVKKIEQKKLLDDALLIQKAGAFAIVLECIEIKSSSLITNKLNIPTIGIGSSKYCDGQILVTDDMLGLSGFYPKFVKKYANLNLIIEKSVQKYMRDIIKELFPKKNNSY